MKIREYTIIKNKFNHPKLEEVNCYEWDGNLAYMDEIYKMLNEVFRMNRLSTEMSYVIALDHAKRPKGVCQVGHGDANEVITSMQSTFTFLMLTGANSFVVVHNHVSDMPDPSKEDNVISMKINMLANMFDVEFIGHMIISPNGYTVDGGIMDGCNSFEEYENDEGNVSKEFFIEYMENNMAATYVFNQRIEGKTEDIEKIVGIKK